MFDTKTWWQSRTIWLQLVAVLFAVLGPLGLLPHGLDQEDVISIIMAIVGIVTIVLRVRQTHAIAKPAPRVVSDAAGKILAIGLSIALPAAMLGSISACATTKIPVSTTAPPLEHVSTAIDRAQAAYDRIAASAQVILPFLSPERQARIRLAMALTERGLSAARNAATIAERLVALKQAEAGTATIETTAAN